jgi:OOP family OmpA-OmpF porin
LILALALAAVLVITGCATPEPEPDPIPVTRTYDEPDVYVPDMLTIQIYYQATGLHKEAKNKLDRYISNLDDPDKLNFTVAGYTCTEGDRTYNKQLSRWRAEAVKRHMVKRGIDSGSITVLGFGVENPVASNRTQMGRVKNRRITITASKAY